jgi:hypothetical protein
LIYGEKVAENLKKKNLGETTIHINPIVEEEDNLNSNFVNNPILNQ